MHTYKIIVVNGGGVEIYAQEIQAKDENKAIYRLLTDYYIILSDGDTIKIEEV